MTETMYQPVTPVTEAALDVTATIPESAPAPGEAHEDLELKKAFDEIVQGIDDAFDSLSAAERETLANRVYDKDRGKSDNGTHRTKI